MPDGMHSDSFTCSLYEHCLEGLNIFFHRVKLYVCVCNAWGEGGGDGGDEDFSFLKLILWRNHSFVLMYIKVVVSFCIYLPFCFLTFLYILFVVLTNSELTLQLKMSYELLYFLARYDHLSAGVAICLF
jgi:hypothetical protein